MIWAPLQVLNILYKIFITITGADLGKIFFQVKDDGITYDPTAEIFKYILMLILIALFLSVILFVVQVVMSIKKQEQVNWWGKVKWPIFVMLSALIIPLAFIIIGGFGLSIFQLINAGSANNIVTRNQSETFISDFNRGLDMLQGLSNDKITVYDATSVAHDLTFDQLFELMSEELTQIRDKAIQGNETNVANMCDDLSNILNSVKLEMAGGAASRLTEWINELRNLININNFRYDEREVLIRDTAISREIANYIQNIKTLQTNWISLITGFKNINERCAGTTLKLDEIPTFNYKPDTTILHWKVQGLINIFGDAQKYVAEMSGSLNYYLLGVKLKDATESVNGSISLWDTMLNSNTHSIEWVDISNANRRFIYTEVIDNGKTLNVTNLQSFTFYLNKDLATTFNMVLNIYQMVTGRTDDDWTKIHGDIGFGNIGIGFVCIAGALFVLALFTLYAIKRIAELMIVWIWLIISACMGIADDGKQFETNRKVCIAKMFTILVMFFCFNLSLTIAAIASKGLALFDDTLINGVAESLITIGCLLGGYSISNWIGRQYGDNSGLGETMQDIGLIRTMGGAMSAVGAGAINLGVKGIKTTGSAVNTATFGGASKLASATGTLANRASGNMFRSREWKSAHKLENVNKIAEASGIGRNITTIGKDGKAVKSFQINGENAQAKQIYNAMMSDRTLNATGYFKKDKVKQQAEIVAGHVENGHSAKQALLHASRTGKDLESGNKAAKKLSEKIKKEEKKW